MFAKRTVRTAGSIATGLALGVGLWTAGLQVGSAQPPPADQDQPTGPALAEALGQELHESFPPPGGCNAYATMEVDGSTAGWCVDEVVDSDYEAWELMNRLQDRPVTELDRQLFLLSMKYANMEDRESKEAQEVARQLEELIALQEATGG